jgi:hypothetical protein
VFVQEGENIGFPRGHAKIEEGVSVFRALTDWLVDFQAMRLSEATQFGV